MGAADNFFQKADQALKKRGYDYAIELLQQGLRIDPDRIGERKKLHAAMIRRVQENGGNTLGGTGFKLRHLKQVSRVKMLGKKKKWEEQIVEISELLKHAPQNTDLLLELAAAFVATERVDCAIQIYSEVVEVARDNIIAWKALGHLWEKKRDPERAVSCWEKVKEARPDDAEAGKAIRDLSAATMLARSEERRGEGEGSFRDLLKDEDEAAKLEKKAAIIRTTDDARTAIDFKREEIDKEPENSRLWRELGDLHIKIKDFEGARGAYERAKEINPGDMYTSDKLGTLTERKFESSIDDLRRELESSPDSAGVNGKLEETLAAQNVFLLEEYPRRVAAHPTDYGLKFKLGEIYFKNERFDEAIAQFQNSRKDPKYATGSHYMIGKSFFCKKLFDLAIREFNSALGNISEADSDSGKSVRYDLAAAHHAKGEKERALELLEEIMSVDINFRDVSKKVDEIRGM
ncbi:MAG: tetratricopeptide repeat protein [Planctomycetota bacterium]